MRVEAGAFEFVDDVGPYLFFSGPLADFLRMGRSAMPKCYAFFENQV